MSYICGYCGKPATDGTVSVSEMGGKKLYLHVQTGPYTSGIPNSPVKVGDTVKDCSFMYVAEHGVIRNQQIMKFTDLEKTAQTER